MWNIPHGHQLFALERGQHCLHTKQLQVLLEDLAKNRDIICLHSAVEGIRSLIWMGGVVALELMKCEAHQAACVLCLILFANSLSMSQIGLITGVLDGLVRTGLRVVSCNCWIMVVLVEEYSRKCSYLQAFVRASEKGVVAAEIGMLNLVSQHLLDA